MDAVTEGEALALGVIDGETDAVEDAEVDVDGVKLG